MAAINGDNYTKAFVNVPSERPNAGDYGGSLRIELDSKAGALAADVLSFGKLPKGARIISINHVGGGTSPVFNVAPMDVLSAETILTITIGASPSATVYAWVEWVLV